MSEEKKQLRITAEIQLTEAQAEIVYLRNRVLVLSQIGNDYMNQNAEYASAIQSLQAALSERAVNPPVDVYVDDGHGRTISGEVVK